MRNSKKKIIIISTFYERIGGISTYTKNMEKALSKLEEIDCDVISPDKSDGSSWPAGRLGQVVKVIRGLRSERPDEIHCHCNWYLQLASVIYAKIFSLKRVKTLLFKHSDTHLESFFLKKYLFFCIDICAYKVVFISNYLRSKYSENISSYYWRSGVINTGVVEKKSSPPVINYLPDEFISYVGLFEYEGKVKGLELLLDAYAGYVKGEDTDICLVVVGHGRLEERIKKRICNNKIKDRVKLLNDVTDPSYIYERTSVHCHITYQDTMPLVILEAISYGAEVIASNVCGIPEIDAQGINLVQNDKQCISDCLSKVLCRDKNEVFLNQSHSWDSIAQKILRM